VKIGIRIESFAIIKYVVYPPTITYIVYCHAKLQLKVILESLWGCCGVVVGHCGSLWGRCEVVVDRCGVVVGRCASFHVLVTTCKIDGTVLNLFISVSYIYIFINKYI
jgi:hypothetical protein